MSELLLQQPLALLFSSPFGEHKPDLCTVWASVGEEGGAGHGGQPSYMDMEFIILKKV